MVNEYEKYLFDAIESIEIINQHLQNVKDFKTFSSNLLVQDAVQRRLAIIGEALWKASKITPTKITDIKKIISFRHILIHDYDKIEIATVWIVITKKLIVLKKEVEAILK